MSRNKSQGLEVCSYLLTKLQNIRWVLNILAIWLAKIFWNLSSKVTLLKTEFTECLLILRPVTSVFSTHMYVEGYIK
jgi:hypothetical protein